MRKEEGTRDIVGDSCSSHTQANASPHPDQNHCRPVMQGRWTDAEERTLIFYVDSREKLCYFGSSTLPVSQPYPHSTQGKLWRRFAFHGDILVCHGDLCFLPPVENNLEKHAGKTSLIAFGATIGYPLPVCTCTRGKDSCLPVNMQREILRGFVGRPVSKHVLRGSCLQTHSKPFLPYTVYSLQPQS